MTQPTRQAGQPSGSRFWYSEMAPKERRTFWACFAGWGTDAADVQMYSLAITIMLTTGFIATKGTAGTIATVTLLASAVGGWLAGFIADRIGRVRMLQIAIAWFAVFTFLSALAPNPAILGLLRALMGLGFGGEWAVGAVLMAETVRAGIRGRAVGTVQGGWAVGWGAAVVLYVLVERFTTGNITWRILFLFGILPGLLVLFLRRHIPEPQIAAQTRSSGQGTSNLLKIFSPQFLGRTLLCCLIAVGAQGGYYALTTWLPQFLKEARGLDVFDIGGTLGVVIVGAFVGYLLGAWAADRIGRRWTLVLSAILALIVLLPFLLLNTSTVVFTILCFPLGMFSSCYFSAVGPLFSEQFPTAVRGSGQGFSYNFGRGIGALFPAAIGFLGDRIPISGAIAIFAGSAYVVLAIGALVIRERTDVDLDQHDTIEASPAS